VNTKPNTDFDAIIIGAGAAGLFCAMTAGARGLRVLVLDHGDTPGKKILISGGGRCNFTNLESAPDRFLSKNPHFCKSALAQYTQYDFMDLVQKHKIAYHEKTLGQLFCAGSAKLILQMLLDECRAASVDLRLNHVITDITKSDRFHVTTNYGTFSARSFVLATGGLSIPKMGATGFTHKIAKQFKLFQTQTYPGLVPLTFSDQDLHLMTPLSGIALNVIARVGETAFQENMLFTHRGLSGPAILQASNYWRKGDTLHIDLFPGMDASKFLLAQKKSNPKHEPKTTLMAHLPTRLAHAISMAHLPEYETPRMIGEIADRDLNHLGQTINQWVLEPSGSEGYAKAEVTVGGIDTSQLSSKTMEANTVPGLHIIGEAVDVTGWLGGYNFQWAWSSGWVAGQALAN
jgi:predicted Rossmann fold flavoprotein